MNQSVKRNNIAIEKENMNSKKSLSNIDNNGIMTPSDEIEKLNNFLQSEGTDYKRSEGTDYKHSEGTDYKHSEGTDYKHSEGTDYERSEGANYERSEGANYKGKRSGNFVNLQSCIDISNDLIDHKNNNKLTDQFFLSARNILKRTKFVNYAPGIEKQNTCLFTSSHAGDGSSFCAINSALSIVNRLNIPVIYIDLSDNQNIFNSFSDLSLGLSDYLSDDRMPLDFASIECNDAQLKLMNLGNTYKNLRYFMQSEEMIIGFKKFCELNSNHFIILEAPSLDAGSDSLMLASIVDEVVLTIKARITTQDDVLQALVNISQNNENVSVMINKF